MSITLYTQVTFSEKFKMIIKSGNYESLIFTLLKSSKKLFPNEFEHIEKQANGECDFVDKKTGAKYDAKLPITKKQGEMIGSNKAKFDGWLRLMIDECTEFGEKMIIERGKHSVEEIELYQIMESLINHDNDDENIIFFFPFPIVYEQSNGIYRQFAMDILSCIYDGLRKNNVVKQQEIYAVYPSADHMIIARNLRTGARENFSAEAFDEYIAYDVQMAR